jgi:ABC-type transport system substrate-binding protein
VYPIVPEYANAYSQFLAKNVISFSPNARDALNVRKDAPDAIMSAGSISTTSFNRQHFGFPEANTSPWKDPRVRIAFRRAVDWESIQSFESNKDNFAAAGIDVELGFSTHAPPDPNYWLDPRKNELGSLSENYMFNAAEAQKLISAAGYPNGFDIDIMGNQRGNQDTYRLMLDQYKQNIPMVNFIPKYVTQTEFYDTMVLNAGTKGFMFQMGYSAPEVDYLLFKQYRSGGAAAAYTDPKLDALVDESRKYADPQKRAEVLKEIQRFCASFFPLVPSVFGFGGWTFSWNWLHNTNQPVHLQWLDQDMPKRNG